MILIEPNSQPSVGSENSEVREAYQSDPRPFAEDQVSKLIALGQKAGLADDEIDAFENFLDGLPSLALGAKGAIEIRTHRQLLQGLERTLRFVEKSSQPVTLSALGNLCPINYLQHFHHLFAQANLRASKGKMTNEEVNKISGRFEQDVADPVRVKAILRFAIDHTKKQPPNTDEKRRSKPALRLDEHILLELIFQTWRRRFALPEAISRSSPLVNFCVSIFEALEWPIANQEPDEAMRKRLGRLKKKLSAECIP